MKSIFVILCAAALLLLTACPDPSSPSKEPVTNPKAQELTPQDILKNIPLPSEELMGSGGSGAARAAEPTIGNLYPIASDKVQAGYPISRCYCNSAELLLPMIKYELSRVDSFTYNKPFAAGSLSSTPSPEYVKYMKTNFHYTDESLAIFWNTHSQYLDFGNLLIKEDSKGLAYTIYFDDIIIDLTAIMGFPNLGGPTYGMRFLIKLTRTKTSDPFDLILYEYPTEDGVNQADSQYYIELKHAGSKVVYRDLDCNGDKYISTKENNMLVEYALYTSNYKVYNSVRINKGNLFSTITFNENTNCTTAQFIDSSKYEALLTYEKIIDESEEEHAVISHSRFFLSALTPNDENRDLAQIYSGNNPPPTNHSFGYHTFSDFDENDITNNDALFWYKETAQTKEAYDAGTAFTDDMWNTDCPEGFTSAWTAKIHEAKTLLTDKFANFDANTTDMLSSIPNQESLDAEQAALHASVTAD